MGIYQFNIKKNLCQCAILIHGGEEKEKE